MERVKIQVMQDTDALSPLPRYQTEGSAGMDLYSEESLTVGSGRTVMVDTGLSVAIPEGYEIQIRSRSGMASKGIFVTNSPGTIDSDYRGKIKVLLTNLSDVPNNIARGDRIAQAVLAHVPHIEWERVEELPSTTRGVGGYGSTGS